MLLKEEKSSECLNVPILEDLGYNIPWPNMASIMAPKAVPDAIVKKLDDAVAMMVKTPSFINGIQDLQLPIMYHSSKDLDAYIAKGYEYYNEVFKEMGLIKEPFFFPPVQLDPFIGHRAGH